MKKWFFLFLAMLGLSSFALAQNTITAAEWFIGTDPGVGLANPITIGSPDDSVSLNITVPTGSLSAPSINYVKVRCQKNSSLWGVPTVAILVIAPGSQTPRLVTQAEWWVDNQAPTLVDPADDDSVSLNAIVATGALTPGLHLFKMRVSDNTGRLGIHSAQQLIVFQTAPPTYRLVTQYEWWVDNGTPTLVDVTDDDSASIAQLVPTGSLTVGLHNFKLRVYDSSGRVGVHTSQPFVVANLPGSNVNHVVTFMDYWFDSDAPTTMNVLDDDSASFATILASNALSVGLHRFNVRSRDEIGRLGVPASQTIIVTAPFGAAQQRIITAAEYWINVDPGNGNGVAIPLPVDGVFDEGQEDIQQLLTGIPLGLHLVGVRVKDNQNRWSVSAKDSLIVGPVLTIRAIAGTNDVALDWQSGSGADQFFIYRAALSNGPFTLIDSTAGVNSTYTDLGTISNPAVLRFYNVAFQTHALSSFRLPALIPPMEK